MKCMKCNGETEVTDTARASSFILRRRRCLECGKVMTTQEFYNDSPYTRKLLNDIRKGLKV
jgi:transcriptional regulator NrdR family protein